MAFVPRTSVLWRLWRTLVRTEVAYFAVPATPSGVDVLKLRDLPAAFAGVTNDYRPTILIDLTQSEEDLWNGVTPQTRKLVRQATRLGVTIEPVAALTEPLWEQFLGAYRKLWSRKHQAGALGVGQIHELIESGRFDLSISRNVDGRILSWHSYVRCNGRARLQTTISDMDTARGPDWNNLIGRAHRLHHWRDMLRFKAEGIATYDLGGVYRGNDDQEQINIARFKQLFGGHFADTYDADVPLTAKGRLALTLITRVGAELRAGGSAAGAPA
jgi:hypothetical protein